MALLAQTLNPLADGATTAVLTEAYRLILPEVLLLATACILFVQGLYRPSKTLSVGLALIALIGAGVLGSIGQEPVLDPSARVIAPIDPGAAAVFVRFASLVVGLLLVLCATKEITTETASDYLACLMVMIAGTSLLGRVNDLILVYITLEMISIPTYVLLYLPDRSKAAQEAAAKYFLLSILSSGVMLFGFSYLFGVTGTTNLTAMHSTLA
ncbi:MAG: proton-conducting transporter membrane subunit, partial [Gemmataceae bacterium]